MTNKNQQNLLFNQTARDTLYEVIFNRRDVRGEFLSDPIDDAVLARILIAAHHAPSVGFMQPWNFLLIDDNQVQQNIHDLFVKANEEAAKMFDGEKQTLYQSLKLEGLLTAPLHVCITCDRDRAGPVVLGRTHMSDMDLYSTVCAVQNFWLAARAENIGVGWVSIFHEEEVKKCLGIPENIHLIAYLTVGHVCTFHQEPDLSRKGWRKRLNLNELIMKNHWDNKDLDKKAQKTNLNEQITLELNRLNPAKEKTNESKE